MKKSFLILLLASVCTLGASAKTVKVINVHDFNEAAKQAVAGDTIILTNGIWNDSRLIVERGQGTAEAPIVVMAETKGGVILMGNSSISISGDYVNVSGLVFTGETPGIDNKYVIETKTSKDDYANNCTISECVVDSFNPRIKSIQTTYVSVWGKNNIIENCYLAGKTCKGPTMIVWPNDERSQENFHRIRRNYFGVRPSFGANGGETLRVGSSQVSKSNSNTTIEENLFERCDGEVEIVSIKSCENQVINNTFFECQGGMTLRHGDRNVVTGNFFNGNDVHNTGGVRIINEGHTVENNLFYKLQGTNFYCSLAIMNGVPGTLINGYHKVVDVDIKHNTFVECGSYFELCVGKGDRDRDDKPKNVDVSKNMIYGVNMENLISEHDTKHGVKFSKNAIFNSNGPMRGSVTKEVEFEMSKSGVNIPVYQDYGIDWADDKFIPSSTNVGPQWYLEQVRAAAAAVPTPKEVAVGAGVGLLAKAIAEANNGDTLILAEGEHIITNPIAIHNDVTLKAADGAEVVVKVDSEADIVYGFELYTGILNIEGIKFDGAGHSKAVNYLFTTGKEACHNFHLVMKGCELYNFNAANGSIFKAYPNGCGDYIIMDDCYVHNSFRVLSLDSEIELQGKYNSEYVILKDSKFENITEWVLHYIRLGVEDSTIGGDLVVENCTFENVYPSGSAIVLDGIKTVSMTNNNGL